MAQIRVRTGKARRSYPRRLIVGYRFVGDEEYEVLECNHLHRTGLDALQVANLVNEYLDDDEVTHRVCKECAPLKPKKARGRQGIQTKIV